MLWEKVLVYMRVSFVFICAINGYQIVECIHLIGTIAQPLLSATWPYLFLILSLIEFQNI